MDALRGLVFWHSLGAAVTGIDYLTAYANATDKMDTNEKFLDENKSDNGLINKWPENKVGMFRFFFYLSLLVHGICLSFYTSQWN